MTDKGVYALWAARHSTHALVSVVRGQCEGRCWVANHSCLHLSSPLGCRTLELGPFLLPSASKQDVDVPQCVAGGHDVDGMKV
jgi:hypothetical protein